MGFGAAHPPCRGQPVLSIGERHPWDPVVWVNPAQPPSVSRCAPRSRSPVSLIVLPRSCSCRWGPCPSPTPRLACPFYLFYLFRVSPEGSRACGYLHQRRGGWGATQQGSQVATLVPHSHSALSAAGCRRLSNTPRPSPFWPQLFGSARSPVSCWQHLSTGGCRLPLDSQHCAEQGYYSQKKK